ncbi:katanin p80 WD40 repeat-containing subunit B1, partial [Trifolium pratense]
MTTKRAYKLPHASAVNCLKIGRKSSRVLVTGGEDHKVNLWAIGKPNAILSLSGHSSGIDSVNFDSSEVLVAAGAASGTIKLWDLEEAKIVRTLTGHRSNCTSVDFHPFGEFFASGSLDTNLKIWDIRKKGCIHTYKGHTRGVNAIRFTPDGRWVVSGGEDNTVKKNVLSQYIMLLIFGISVSNKSALGVSPAQLLYKLYLYARIRAFIYNSREEYLRGYLLLSIVSHFFMECGWESNS